MYSHVRRSQHSHVPCAQGLVVLTGVFSVIFKWRVSSILACIADPWQYVTEQGVMFKNGIFFNCTVRKRYFTLFNYYHESGNIYI